jgi:hypothetical protein
MLPRPYPLAVLLLLLPVIAMADGLAMAPLAAVLFVMLAWQERKALAGWRSMYPLHSCGVHIVLLLTVWPVLTSLWSIIPHVSLVTSLRSAAFLLLAPAGVFLARRQDGKTAPALWALPALGIVIAVLCVLSSKLPHEGVIGVMTRLLKRNTDDYLARDIDRGICALTVLVWPAMIGLVQNGRRRQAMCLPWLLLLALFCLHSLSAKTGLIAGMLTFYAMMLCPKPTRRIMLWAVPLLFITWPVVFHLCEPTLRGPLWNSLPPSSRHRVEIWHFALEKWQERPWLGWGVDSSRAIPGGLEEIWPGLVKLPLHPHNLPLHVLLEQGMIGFILFAVALSLFVRQVLPGQPSSPAVDGAKAGALISYLVVGMSGFGMWQGWWIATGITAFLMTTFANEKKYADANA